MKRTALFILAVSACAAVFADTYTRGYVRQDGTYVQGHYSTNPNSTRADNYSTQGNVNPYTGKSGTVSPYLAPGGLTQPPRAPSYGTPQQAPLTQPDPYGLRNSRRF